MHALAVTSPHQTSVYIGKLQRIINVRAHALGLDGIPEDNDFGVTTLLKARQILYYEGVVTDELHGRLTVHGQQVLFFPNRWRNPAEHYRGGVRQKILKKKLAADHHGPNGMIAWAKTQLGEVEHPAGSNEGGSRKDADGIWSWGPTGYQRNFGLNGQPWCGAFVGTALLKAGAQGVSSRIVYVPYIAQDFEHVGYEERRAGDVICFNFGAGLQHTGFFDADRRHTFEGNTSPGDEGSQDNGGCVAHRLRDPSTMAVIVRPRF